MYSEPLARAMRNKTSAHLCHFYLTPMGSPACCLVHSGALPCQGTKALPHHQTPAPGVHPPMRYHAHTFKPSNVPTFKRLNVPTIFVSLVCLVANSLTYV